jgi:hypothetical protein
MSLKKYIRGFVSLLKSQVKAVEVTVNSKEENSLETFVRISSENSASVRLGQDVALEGTQE